MDQQGDVLLFNTVDNGDIEVVGGLVTMSGGLGTAVYLSLFGGNILDDGRSENKFTWWGNYLENLPENKYVSETQYLLKSLPATTSNLRRVEDASLRDVNWLLNIGAASKIESLASIPAIDTLQLNIAIEAVGEEARFTFTENWKSTV
jgi:phage gp46-like protein